MNGGRDTEDVHHKKQKLIASLSLPRSLSSCHLSTSEGKNIFPNLNIYMNSRETGSGWMERVINQNRMASNSIKDRNLWLSGWTNERIWYLGQVPQGKVPRSWLTFDIFWRTWEQERLNFKVTGYSIRSFKPFCHQLEKKLVNIIELIILWFSVLPAALYKAVLKYMRA